jgi:hypothetical protein
MDDGLWPPPFKRPRDPEAFLAQEPYLIEARIGFLLRAMADRKGSTRRLLAELLMMQLEELDNLEVEVPLPPPLAETRRYQAAWEAAGLPEGLVMLWTALALRRLWAYPEPILSNYQTAEVGALLFDLETLIPRHDPENLLLYAAALEAAVLEAV